MINKQDQNVSGNGVAVQAQRDAIINNGLSVSDVKELTELFLDKHLPALRAEAAETARKQANQFMGEFVKKLSLPNGVTAEAFAKPDSQACFNEALRSSAEKGDQIDLEFLASLVVRRLEVDKDPLMKLVYEEAISVTPKLTSAQIAFIVFVHHVTNIELANPTIEMLERDAQMLLPLVKASYGLSIANKEYLVSKGILNVAVARGLNATDIREHYRKDVVNYPKSAADVKSKYPNFWEFTERCAENSIVVCKLTTTGKLIALSAMEPVYGRLDFSIWIN
ncbi:LPO_1073/Vpar_1526 family protein [Pseudomonas putida]|uniref:LPO_1073/Vpar_1526 family protein n=1 Tax=Pseudomonas putida TaxID=303 RepID=UPI002363F875|nr:LPO_1073/Vpar_1526 family protein [Pseudomonas putida]MDD2145311.1 hypothetical protein [Pseudomonas putida]HDS1709452.1 hypothetical protein [Pseudomonas putida]